ncbi:MAG: sulfatase-like hydrolase/transferase [Rikenellaceae bacterium]
MNSKFLPLLTVGLGTVVSCNQSPKSGEADKPNLLIIHTDEHSFRTLSCYQNQLPESEGFVWGAGCNVKTPNIDRIAAEGAICMSYYCAAPVSTPSRAAMVSGLYSQETDAWKNDIHIRKDIPTFASILRENGYSTSYVGKWHLAGHTDQYTFDPEYDGGFTDKKFMMNKGHSPYFELDKEGNVLGAVNQNQLDKVKERGNSYIHLTDFFTDKTLDILKRDKDKPFCVMLSIPDPHTPDYARPPYHNMYDDMNPTMPESMKPEHANKRPAWALSNKNEPESFNPAPLKQYFGMVKHIDDSVGRLLSYLEEVGELDNTIVLFTSDHGEMFYEHKRMNKGNPYEAAARIPFVIRYPKSINKGTVIDKAMCNVSFTPTMLGLMGVDTDATFSGTNDAADFTSNQISDPHRICFYAASASGWVAAVDNQYKLIISTNEEPWLLDLDNDPNEYNNIYKDPKYKDVVGRLQTALKKELSEHKLVADGTTLIFE